MAPTDRRPAPRRVRDPCGGAVRIGCRSHRAGRPCAGRPRPADLDSDRDFPDRLRLRYAPSRRVTPPAPARKRVLLAAPRGYCAGVDRAVDRRREGARALRRPGVRAQGDRPQQVRRRDARRPRRVFVDETDEVPEGARVVFSAHGVSPAVHAAAAARTCRRSTRPARWSPRCTRRPSGSPPTTTTSCSSATTATRRSRAPHGEAPDHIQVVNSPDDGRPTSWSATPTSVVWLSQTTLSVDETMETVRRLRERFPQPAGPAERRHLLRHAEPPGRGEEARAGVRPGHRGRLGELVELGAAGRGRARRRAPAPPTASTRPRRSTRPGSTASRTVGVTSGASVPEILVRDVLDAARRARLRRRRGGPHRDRGPHVLAAARAARRPQGRRQGPGDPAPRAAAARWTSSPSDRSGGRRRRGDPSSARSARRRSLVAGPRGRRTATTSSLGRRDQLGRAAPPTAAGSPGCGVGRSASTTCRSANRRALTSTRVSSERHGLVVGAGRGVDRAAEPGQVPAHGREPAVQLLAERRAPPGRCWPARPAATRRRRSAAARAASSGVAMTTLRSNAYSMSAGSCSAAACRNDSAGTNITTNSGAGANWSQYRLAARSSTCARTCRACAASRSARTRSSVGLRGLEEPEERDLGVDHDVLAAREPDHHVGPQQRRRRCAPASCSTKSTCASIPAASTTRRSCSSPHRPRTCDERSAVTSWAVSPRRCSEASRIARTCSPSAACPAARACSAVDSSARTWSSVRDSGSTMRAHGLLALGQLARPASGGRRRTAGARARGTGRCSSPARRRPARGTGRPAGRSPRSRACAPCRSASSSARARAASRSAARSRDDASSQPTSTPTTAPIASPEQQSCVHAVQAPSTPPTSDPGTGARHRVRRRRPPTVVRCRTHPPSSCADCGASSATRSPSPASTSSSRPARSTGSSAPTAPARRPRCRWPPACCSPTSAPCWCTGTTCGRRPGRGQGHARRAARRRAPVRPAHGRAAHHLRGAAAGARPRDRRRARDRPAGRARPRPPTPTSSSSTTPRA